MGHEPEITEYLYVDMARLDTYLSQCGGPNVYDKVPVWSVEASLLGPKATGQQVRVARQRTLHEKVEYLLEWLTKHKHLSTTRPTSYFQDDFEISSRVFCLEIVPARRVLIPSRGASAAKAGLALWASVERSDSNSHSLVLVEGCSLSDLGQVQGCGVSHFSALIYLVSEMREQVSETIILPPSVKKFMEKKKDQTYGWLDDAAFFLASMDNAISGRELVDDSPVRLLHRLGCHIGDQRLIRVLYRVRTVSDAGHGVFGYPIFIAEASVVEKRKHEMSQRRPRQELEAERTKMKKKFYRYGRYDGD